MKRVISLSNIKLASINQKYIISKSTGKLILSSRYRNFKKLLQEACQPINFAGPYAVIIHMDTYLDIDNPLKCILDALQETITNDNLIYELRIFKTPVKRGAPSRLDVYVDSMVLKCNAVFKSNRED